MVAKNGDLYGKMGGQLYRISSSGDFSTNMTYNGSKGPLSITGLIRGKDGLLFGVITRGTKGGGILRIDTKGEFIVFCQFTGLDKSSPFPSEEIIEATDGCFYGYCFAGDFFRDCSIVRLKSDGTITKLYSFNGVRPEGSLVEGKNGKLYGTTDDAKWVNNGTIFCFTPPNR